MTIEEHDTGSDGASDGQPALLRVLPARVREAFGWRAKLSTVGFPALSDPKAGMAAIRPDGRRIFLAANDFAFVDPAVVAWADVVGQVNVDPDANRSPKVVPLGPSSGTPWSSRLSLAAFVVRARVMKAPGRTPAMLRDYLHHQVEREPVAAYVPGVSDPAKVFFLANFWSNAPEANQRRLRFVKAVQRTPGGNLEGGFWNAGGMPSEYEPFRMPQRVRHADYLDRTRRSAVVFNTPAMHDCLGWKLGEFLALGKAIVSTPLGREMPGRFEHGEHVHVVEGDEDSIVRALVLVAVHHDYRTKLERNARRYWEEYLAPMSVARRVVAAGTAEGEGSLHD